MERGVRVNAEYRWGGVPDGADAGPTEGFAAPASAAAVDYGPCLYLGPGGQRCNRRAVEGGFCEQHEPGAAKQPVVRGPAGKRVAALIAALAALAPLLADLIREIIRLLR